MTLERGSISHAAVLKILVGAPALTIPAHLTAANSSRTDS